MDIWLGLALVGLTLFASILSYALRTYSRAKLADYLSEEQERKWMERLDRYETELQVVASTLRLSGILGLAVYVVYMYRPEGVARDSLLDAAAEPLITFGLLLVFALGIPNAIALHAGEAVLARSLGLLWVLRFVLWPLERGLMALDFIVRRLLGKSDRGPDDSSERAEQEILEAVEEGELHGAVDEDQKEMIESIFELHETTVSEIMTPRTDIIAIPSDATFEQARETIVQAGHSRIPVYEGTLDHIIGVLYAKDLLRLKPGDPFDVREIMRHAPFVPESKTLDALLNEFRATKVQIAIVLDEYGGTSGLATIEDILEELVGEIDDEYDQKAPPAIIRVDEDTLEVDARVHVYEVNEELDISLPEDGDYETIGGFVFATMGKIPAKGEEFTHENVHFQVVDAEPRRINRLRIRVQRQAQEV